MLQYIADYITDLHHFLTVTPKIITISKTIPNNNIAAGVYVVINSEEGIASYEPHTPKLKQ